MIYADVFQVGIIIRKQLADLGKFARLVFDLDHKPRALLAVTCQLEECLKQVLLGDDTDNLLVTIHNRQHIDLILQHDLSRILNPGIRRYCPDICDHDVFCICAGQQIVQLIDGKRRILLARVLIDQSFGNQTDQSAILDNRKPVEMILAHDLQSLQQSDIRIDRNGV